MVGSGRLKGVRAPVSVGLYPRPLFNLLAVSDNWKFSAPPATHITKARGASDNTPRGESWRPGFDSEPANNMSG